MGVATQFANFCAGIGRPMLGFLSTTGQLSLFSLRSFAQMLTPPYRPQRYAEQMLKVGVRSLPIASLVALFIGMVIMLQTGYQLMRFGAKLYSAGITVVALSREMIPIFTAVVVGARVAASITAELGTMKVTEQIDAMEAMAVNPLKYLVVPRVVASTITLPMITIYANLVGYVGGMFIGAVALGIPPRQYYNNTLQFIMLSDFYSGLLKAVVFGGIIGVIGCFQGFRTTGGAEGVGRATTVSVVLTLVLILIWDYILNSWIMLYSGLIR
jgi:phospholipid/cholesterol/gamma-HCH transport system permease protein